MTGDARLLYLVYCMMFGCATELGSGLVREDPSAAAIQPREPGMPLVPGAKPQSMRMVAITDATDFALHPRIVGKEQVVVPLPADRTHLVNVDVGLLVIRRDTGEIMDRQEKSFNWKTSGTALHFFLPRLPAGDYIAEVRTTSKVTTSTGELEFPDLSQVSFRSDNTSSLDPVHLLARTENTPRQSTIPHEFRYHFEIHHSPKDVPVLIPGERDQFELNTMRLTTVLQNNEVAKVTLDCWASSDGAANYNRQVSEKRCEWVRSQVLNKLLPPEVSAKGVITAPHGEDNPPEPEPAGIAPKELRRIQEKNRVVILKVYTSN